MDFQKILEQLGSSATDIALKLVASLLILFVGGRLIRWLLNLLQKGKAFQKLERSVQTFAKSFLRIAFYAILIITVAGILGIPMTSFVTLLASAGVAIGLALQGALSNLAGGLMILIFHPFKVGDYIKNGDLEGTVKEINIFYTILQTAENKKVTIPNGTLTNSSVINSSANGMLRVDLPISVGYDSDIPTVDQLLMTTATANPLVLKDPAPFASLISHGDSALVFTLRVWCNAADYWTVYFDLCEKTKMALDEANISIPYPQLDVHLNGLKNESLS